MRPLSPLVDPPRLLLLLLPLLHAATLLATPADAADGAGRRIAGGGDGKVAGEFRRQLAIESVGKPLVTRRTRDRVVSGGLKTPAAAGPCSLVSCPKGCTCSRFKGVARCACPDPCFGVKCPDVSKCVNQRGTAVCKCPKRFKRLIDNKCSSAPLAHSDYLNPHNEARAAVGAVPLVWDDEVAARAQAWADTLASDNNCGLEHGGMEGDGQNLSGGGPSGSFTNTDAVVWWVDEGQHYSLDTPMGGCVGSDWWDCGHYSQVVWNDSRRLGCGKASCGQDSDVWACNYSPPGNFGGELPFAQDVCFRVRCPSTATCSDVDGTPLCRCPPGQALVSNKCKADPCIGAAKCPGDLVCDGSSGAPKCACPRGMVQVAPKICLAPSCVRVKCPAMARCKADRNGIPFCACPASYSLVDGACSKGAPTTVTTSIALFNQPSFTNDPASLAPTVLRAPTPDTDGADGCVNIPAPMTGNVGSLKVMWDAPDGSKGQRVVCGTMWFWDGDDCFGGAAGWFRPDNDVTNADTTDGGVAVVRAISCSA